MKKNVLVSIVSDQTLPNILIIKELEQINFELLSSFIPNWTKQFSRIRSGIF